MLRRIAFVLSTAVASLALFATGASAEGCPNEAVRQEQHAQGLPDCRAWEQVSPQQKFGYSVGGNAGPGLEIGVGSGGDRVTYTGVNPLSDGGSGSLAGLLGVRNAGGWSGSSLFGPPGANQIGGGLPSYDAWMRGSTPDQQLSVYYDNTTAPYGSLWIVRADGTRQKIADSSAPAFTTPGEKPGNPDFEGISADGRHVVFGDTDALVPGITPTGSEILYEWVDDGANGGAGTLRVVNRTNDPTLTLLGSSIARLGGSGGATLNTPPTRTQHAISADGKRIYFQTPAPEKGNNETPIGGGPLYLRTAGASTVEVSAPAPGHAPAATVEFLGASLDGRVAYFWSDGQLTDDAAAEGGIYRYDAGTEHLSFVDTAPLIGSGFTSFPPSALVSDDGSRIYYQRGLDIYVSSAGEHRLVLANAEIADPVTHLYGLRDGAGASANLSRPDGRYFSFEAVTGNGASQVYRYDDNSGVTELVSSSPTGPDPSEYSSEPSGNFDALTASIETRFMSDDGHYVFFVTNAALVPQDTNKAQDAYEWHDGQVSLLGSGTDPGGSVFLGSDATGENAFFSTPQPLAPQDGDPAWDIYDARIDGGFPLSHTTPCNGETCQGTLASPPVLEATASASSSGQGNLLAPGPKPAVKPLTRAQKLAKALKRCRSKHRKRKRASCEALARKQYRAAARSKKTARKSTDGKRSK
jgi:hypothetical protein